MIKATAFICGCGHSGTSLLANMFAANPQTYVPLRETNLFYSRRAKLRLAREKLRAMLRGKRYLVEKTPKHIAKVAEIRALVPGAKIIMLVRDGRDVVASYSKRFTNLDRGIQDWIEANRIVLRERGSPDVAVVRYEDLITDPERELRRLCEFAGIPFARDMLDYHAKKRLWFGAQDVRKGSGIEGAEHRNLRNWQINQPLFDGRGKWKEVFDEVPAALREGDGLAMMQAFGYEDDASANR